MNQVLVHVRCNAAGAVRREKMDGRDVIIVPSATLPDDIIMNDILYPSAEIEKSFASLDDTPAPLGHPTVNGKFVSARSPRGINIGWVGAFNTNARREKGKNGKHRVLLDKVIDVERANQSEGGRTVLAAIEKGGPIHTSTGLLCNLEAANGDVPYKHIARNIEFDHDAILLDEEGAATPEQGVGIFVNSSGKPEEIQVINSSLAEDIDREIDWAGSRLVEALKRRESAGTWEKMKSAIMEAFGFSEREPSTNRKEPEMPVTDEQFKALSDEVKALSEGMTKIGETVTNAVTAAVKPIIDAQAEIVANQKAKDDAEKAELEAKVVKANILDEETAKATPLNTLRALAKKAEPGKAAPLNSAFKGAGDDKPAFKLPKGD
jgi:hypothetical protein